MNTATTNSTTGLLVTAGKPIKTWQLRRSEEVVMQVWRVIANSGARGISPADIRSRMNNIAADMLKQHLHELRRKGHIRFDSPTNSNRVGCWVATARLPLNQDAPLWMQDLGDKPDNEGAHATDQAAKGSAAVQAACAGAVPNSVFALGQAVVADFGVDIDSVHMPAEHKQALAEAAPPAPEPAPAPAAEPEAEAGPELTATDNTQPLMPLFSLQSDGTLAGTLEDGRVLHMSPNDTRHLFAFLDRLMAIGHGSLSEAAA